MQGYVNKLHNSATGTASSIYNHQPTALTAQAKGVIASFPSSCQSYTLLYYQHYNIFSMMQDDVKRENHSAWILSRWRGRALTALNDCQVCN